MPPGNCQCPGVNFSWRCSYPEMVPKILPFCGSACTSDHNKVSIHKAHGLPCTTLASACWITRPCEAFAAGWPTTRAVLRVQVFLEGVKAALTADAKYNGGNYSPDDKPIVGLKAFGRVYAGESSHLLYHRLHVPCSSHCSHVKWLLRQGALPKRTETLLWNAWQSTSTESACMCRLGTLTAFLLASGKIAVASHA